MSKNEMLRRLATVSEEDRLSMYRSARDGESGFAVAGWDRSRMKISNAVFKWIEHYGSLLPTDEAITP